MLAAAAGALATALIAGIATAAIPGDGGVVNGCYLKVGGILRVIDTAKGQKCLPNAEVALNWNQQGQAGVPGLPGAQGQPGQNGEKGENGDKGEPGQNGVDGQPGQQGPAGEGGPQGEPGQDGAPGATGDKGDPGGVSGYEIISHDFTLNPGGSLANQNVQCPIGKVILGGAARGSQTDGLRVYGGVLAAPFPRSTTDMRSMAPP